MFVTSRAVGVFGGVFEVDGPGLGAVKVEFADDAYVVFRGVEEML